MFEVIDAAVVRAAPLSGTEHAAGWPDFAGDTDAHIAWLRDVFAVQDFAGAVETASPVLAERARTVCRGQETRPGEVRRLVESVARYLVRAASRATPFGLFAGVASARLGSSTRVRWGTNHQARARVDAVWLDSVVTRLEANPVLRSRLRVVANSAAVVRDGRLVLAAQARPGTADETKLGEISVRYTRAVRAAMHATATPPRLQDAATTVAGELDAAAADVEPLLAGLLEQGFLVSSMRPSLLTPDPLTHVVTVLDDVDADTVSEVADLVGQIRAVHAELVAHDTADGHERARTRRTEITTAMASPAYRTVDRPLGVDLRLDCDLTLPPSVVTEIEAAATALTRLAPRQETPGWRQYHQRFLERYGPRALVPVTDLVADTGLGFPAGYRDSQRLSPADEPLSDRDATLLAWAQRAAWRHQSEIVLDNAMFDELDPTGGPSAVQPHTELRVRVHAPSRTAVDRGEFELAVAGVSRGAGTTTGRFLDLLDADDQRRITGAYASLPRLYDDAIQVQVSAPALFRRTDNVARSPRVLTEVVSLGEHHDAGERIPVEDLAVTADLDRMLLVSRSRQRPVEAVAFNAVELTGHAHPLVRFLIEISTTGARGCVPFSWGPVAARLPFLPRVRFGRTILAPALWRINTADLGPEGGWEERFACWWREFRVPATVYVGDDDRRMRLDLTNTAHRHLLRRELDSAGRVLLREAPAAEALAWFDGHPHEVVIPLASTRPPVTPLPWTSETRRAHGQLPGGRGSWWSVKLYGHPDRQDAVLHHLPELLAASDGELEWWFLRYHDPDPHLRLRIRPQNHHPDLAGTVQAWTDRLRQRGLIGRVQIDTFYPEARFGAGKAQDAAEALFTADSRAVLAQLGTARHRVDPVALVAASMVDLACAFHDTDRDGLRWLITHARMPSHPAPERTVRDTAIRLADPRADVLHALPGGQDLAAAWRQRQHAAQDYRRALETTDLAPDRVLADLLHLHHARAIGVVTSSEQACLHLARAAALSWTHRTQEATS